MAIKDAGDDSASLYKAATGSEKILDLLWGEPDCIARRLITDCDPAHLQLSSGCSLLI